MSRKKVAEVTLSDQTAQTAAAEGKDNRGEPSILYMMVKARGLLPSSKNEDALYGVSLTAWTPARLLVAEHIADAVAIQSVQMPGTTGCLW